MVNIKENKSLHLLISLRNFDDIFMKNVNYEKIKSHKKQDFTLSLQKYILEKIVRGRSLFRVKTLKNHTII